MRIRYRTDVYKKNPNTNNYSWNTASYTTTEAAFGMEVTDSIGVGKDTFKFTLANPQGVLTTSSTAMVEMDDNIKIYQWTGTGSPNTATDWIMDGIVKDVQYEQSPDGRNINVSGVHFIESIFNSIVFVDLTSTNVATASLNILARVNELQQNALQDNSRYIAGSEYADWTSSGNPTMGSSAAFPTFSISENKQNAAELLDKIWANDYTSDGSYMWWVERNTTNNKMEFKCQKLLDNPQNTVTQSQNEIKWNTGYTMDGVFNVVYYNCGYDAYGNGQEYFYFDEDSMSKFGPISRYWDKTSHVGADVLVNEFRHDTAKSLFNWTSTGQNDTVTGNFPKAFPYTMNFLTGNSYPVATSSQSYNQLIRKRCEDQGKTEVINVVKLNGKPIPKLTVDYAIASDPDWQVKTVYTITGSDTLIKDSINMRCIQKKYSDWEVSYEFQQDADFRSK